MQDKIQKIKQTLQAEIQQAVSLEKLEEVYAKFLGRKGELTLLFKQVKDLPTKEKPVMGKLINQVKQEVEEIFQQAREKFSNQKQVTSQTDNKKLDITLPGTPQNIGTLHPITQIKNDLNDAFKWLGFEVYEGPEITSDQYAFDNMNFPADHPARESMDTYWVAQESAQEKLCLRPHLTGASVRYMQTHQPPFRFVYPGRVFRAEATDAGHERTFYQYEALIVNKDISFTGGKILVKTILERVFGREVKIRMRAGFFPFVEPGFEIDMQCLNCGGKGCSVCGHSGWLEMMPGGVPHPNVFKAGGIDAQEWQGFYINIGLDRLVMMKYGIDDIRLFHSGDLRFLKQF